MCASIWYAVLAEHQPRAHCMCRRERAAGASTSAATQAASPAAARRSLSPRNWQTVSQRGPPAAATKSGSFAGQKRRLSCTAASQRDDQPAGHAEQHSGKGGPRMRPFGQFH
jgi:hypothetical protein